MKPFSIITREPVMVAIVALVGATIALLVTFNVHVTADQREAIEGWVGTVLALGLAVRSQVTPKGNVPASEPLTAHGLASALAQATANVQAAKVASAAKPADADASV